MQFNSSCINWNSLHTRLKRWSSNKNKKKKKDCQQIRNAV